MRLSRKILTMVAVIAATALPGTTALAAPVEVTRTTNAFTSQINTCNGEFVELEGTSIRLHFSDGTGQRIIHATGVGDQGNVYTLNVRTTAQFNIRTVDSVLISQGAVPNQRLTVDFDSNTGVTITVIGCTPGT
jgi:hypothetical protein